MLIERPAPTCRQRAAHGIGKEGVHLPSLIAAHCALGGDPLAISPGALRPLRALVHLSWGSCLSPLLADWAPASGVLSGSASWIRRAMGAGRCRRAAAAAAASFVSRRQLSRRTPSPGTGPCPHVTPERHSIATSSHGDHR